MRQTQTTHGIEISVTPVFQKGYSNPQVDKYVFAYYVTIKNTGQETVQLLHRHWFIYDSGSQIREVKGPGVIGQTPVLHPGEQFEYNSWTEMKTTVGKMYGYYIMKRLSDDQDIEVEIPEFQLIPPFINN